MEKASASAFGGGKEAARFGAVALMLLFFVVVLDSLGSIVLLKSAFLVGPATAVFLETVYLLFVGGAASSS